MPNVPIATLALVFLCVPNMLAAKDKPIIGWIEPVLINPGNIVIQAKIDTGADNSSLHASDLEEFYRDGQNWVKFNLKDHVGKRHVVEQPIFRYTKIKRRGVESQKRAVILLQTCLGQQLKKVEVNLTDRKNYEYKMLIGRSFLKDSFLIDVDEKNTTQPSCKI